AEDGIRDFHVTGVQTCALPICSLAAAAAILVVASPPVGATLSSAAVSNLGVSNSSVISRIQGTGGQQSGQKGGGAGEGMESSKRSEERRVGRGRRARSARE